MLTSRTYPLLFTESIRVHNVQDVSDVKFKKLYQKSSPDPQNIAVTIPRVTSLSISNRYNIFRQAPSDFIKVLKPRVLSLSLRNLNNKLNPQEESLSISLPSITLIGVRELLRKHHTWGLDETITVYLPNSVEIYKENVVNSYDNSVSTDFKMGLPIGIELGGSVKPVLTFPVLKGEIVNENLVELTWDDSSITHTGYTLYKSLKPIPVATMQEPYKQLGRDVKQFDDPVSIPLDTSVYYRVTPRTVYGNLFSNQVEVTHRTTKVITFMMQESPTYIPLRVDNNIIPLVPTTATEGSKLNAGFEQLVTSDTDIVSEYIPTPLEIEMRTYNE